MGALCSCFQSSKNFQGEGRTLGSEAPRTTTAAAAPPSSSKISAPSGGRTLGKNAQAPNESQSPGQAAARAAEERAKASGGKGKLGKQLDAQKAKTQTETLAQSARDNVAARGMDEAAETRNWN